MKLGLLTAPFPETPLMDVADWARGQRLRESSRSPAGRRPPAPTRRYAGTSHIDVANLSAQPGDARSSTRSRAKGLAISGLGYYPNPLHPDPAHRERGHRPPQARHHGRREDGRPAGQHVHGRRRARRTRTRTGKRRSASGPTSSPSPRTTARKITIENCPMLFSIRRVAGRPQHRHDAPHLAPDPRAVGRHDRAQLRPVAPGPPDDRHRRGSSASSGRTSSTSRPRTCMIDRDGPVRARRRSRWASAGRSRACPASATSTGRRLLRALYRAGYDGDCIIEHEDRDFERHRRPGQARASCSRATSSARTASERPDEPISIDDLTDRDIAKTIDHSLLRPELDDAFVEDGCRLAAEYDVASVCVRPADVARAARRSWRGRTSRSARPSASRTATTAPRSRCSRRSAPSRDGATELDMVIQIGALKSGRDADVEADIGPSSRWRTRPGRSSRSSSRTPT